MPAAPRKTVPRKTATKKATPKAEVGFTVEMGQTKETKGTFVYTSDEDETAIPTLYIRKTAFPDGAPSSITVTIS